MKLSKVKRICKSATQLTLIDIDQPENMVLQWIGTTMAMYPIHGTRLSLGAFRAMWDLTELEMNAMQEIPAMADVEVLKHAPGLIDKDTLPWRGVAYLDGYLAVHDGEGKIYYINEDLLAPCRGGVLRSEVVHASGEAWALVYTDGELSGVLRPTDDTVVKNLTRTVEVMAGMTPWMRGGEILPAGMR